MPYDAGRGTAGQRGPVTIGLRLSQPLDCHANARRSVSARGPFYGPAGTPALGSEGLRARRLVRPVRSIVR